MVFNHKDTASDAVNDRLDAEVLKSDETTDYVIDDFENWRKSEDMTQQEFASMFGISASTYGQWVSGRREPPAYVLNMMRQIIDNAWVHDLMDYTRTNGRHLGCIICKELEGHNQRRHLPDFTDIYEARIQMLSDDSGTTKPYLVLAEIKPEYVDKLTDYLNDEFISDIE